MHRVKLHRQGSFTNPGQRARTSQSSLKYPGRSFGQNRASGWQVRVLREVHFSVFTNLPRFNTRETLPVGPSL